MDELYDGPMEKMFAYDDWANREEVAALRAIAAPPRAMRILSHIAGTQWVWLERLRGGPPAVVWPEWTIEQCAAQFDALRHAWRELLPGIERTASITYTNSMGQQWTSRAGDVLTHVILHGAYHRGQIALIVRDSGETPPYTDFIHCTRAGLLPES